MYALITARSGSKSIPHKNIKLLNGTPLLCWSIQTALDCGLEPVVSSDSRNYLDLAERYGAKGLLRPADFSQDNTPHFDVIKFEAERLGNPDEMVLFQPTAPFRKNEDVKGAIEKFRIMKYDSLIHVVQVPEEWHPDVVMQIAGGEIRMASGSLVKDRIKRRQDHRPAFVPSGGLYVFKTRNLTQGNFYGDNVGVYEVVPTVNINTTLDFKRADEIALTWKA